MNSDASVLKWAAVVGAVIIGCFCLGFFLGPNLSPGRGEQVASAGSNPAPVTGSARPRRSATIADETDSVTREEQNRQRRKDDAAKESERKREEEAKRKADAKAKEEAAKADATPTPEPSPEAKTEDAKPADPREDKPGAPTPDDTGDIPAKPGKTRPAASDAPAEETPKAEEKPRVKPTPRATPRPVRPAGFRVRLEDSPDEGVARRRAEEIRNATGMSARVVTETVGGKKRYRVQVDAKDKEDANRKADELRSNGYNGSVDD